MPPGYPVPRPEWAEQCPARGAGLGHAHWRECRPPNGHPESDPTTEFVGRVHQYEQCCHCEEVITSVNQAHPVQQGSLPPAPATIRDHGYVPTMAGWCAKCRQPQVAHGELVHLPTMEAVQQQADELGLPKPCTVDHASLTSKHLIGDGGLVWSSCPSCGVQLEPKFVSGNGPEGKKWGWGRGESSPRFLKRVEAYVGWLAFLAQRAS